MWRMHVLAKFLKWWGLLEIGISMADGSYYRESVHDEQNFPDPVYADSDGGDSGG
jgi:hypothetical protein